MTDCNLTAKVVLVAGGAKNLGGLISREFASKGAKVVVHYHSQAAQQEAETTVQAVQRMGCEAFALQGDLTQPENVATLFEQAKDRFGRIDVAVNTVGKVLRKPIFK
ncbi:MAG: SDR family NAD(P)-dependent oxidoreductase [Phormidesmis sp. RL_2_1]|nr:SDR family NAD(P)-dependent oxidoreductase [Phormidesmis sp. RL_2_1]